MVIHPQQPDLVLVEAGDVAANRIPDRFGGYSHALHSVVGWARSYLCRPHPQLGRRGAVCPYAKASLDGGAFFLTVRAGRPDGPWETAELLRRYRDWFVDLDPRLGRDAKLKTVLILFPDLEPADWPTIIDGSQRLLKTDYVQRGFMLGEFHDGPPVKAGLRNGAFRPLRSPVPMLVIRHMVATDLAFLDGDRGFFRAYLQRFGDQVPAGELPRFEAAVRRFAVEQRQPVGR